MSSPSEQKAAARLRVAISGAGIGGMALAAFICQHCDDVAVDVYETKPEVSTAGIPIAIWKRAWQTMQDIGLDDELKKRGLPPPREGGSAVNPIFRKADQPAEGFDFFEHRMPYGPISLPRPVLLDMLQEKCTERCTIHTSKSVVDFKDEDDGVTIYLKDGTETKADVLVGCDGVHSRTRVAIYSQLAQKNKDQAEYYEGFCEPKWCGTLAYRGVVMQEKLRELHPEHQALKDAKVWCGKDKHVVSHPFGPIVNMICFYNVKDGYGRPFDGPWVADVSTQEVVDSYEGWEPDLLSLVQLIEKPSRWAIHVVDVLPVIVSGSVVLVGDAAHAMTTHQGVGGAQAVEDAHILGRLLAHPKTTKGNLKQSLDIYEQIRKPISQEVARKSWQNGLMYDFKHPDYPVKSDATAQDMLSLGNAVEKAFAWLGEGGTEDDWKHAESLLLQLSA